MNESRAQALQRFLAEHKKHISADTCEIAVAFLDARELVGGPMPEPWPGMGVEVVRDNGDVDRFLSDPMLVDGVWYLTLVGEDDMPDPERTFKLSEASAIYDGRTCIWRRA